MSDYRSLIPDLLHPRGSASFPVLRVDNLLHQAAIVEELVQEFNARDSGSIEHCSRAQVPLVFTLRQDPTLPGFKLGTQLPPRQNPVPWSRPASTSKDSVEVVSLGFGFWSHVSFCILTDLLRPCLAHTVWPDFMEVNASLTTLYVLQNSP